MSRGGQGTNRVEHQSAANSRSREQPANVGRGANINAVDSSRSNRAWESDSRVAPRGGDGSAGEGRAKTRPVHEFRMGRISAAIWENHSEQGIRHNVTVCKKYKTGDQWRETQSYSREDLPLVIKVLDQCHTWIYTHGNSSPDDAKRPKI